MNRESNEGGPPSDEFDKDGNFRQAEAEARYLFENDPTLERTEEQDGLRLIDQRKNEEGRVVFERKRGYKDQAAKETGELQWGNENRYVHDEKGRTLFEQKLGFKSEDDLYKKNLDWGQQRRFEYNDAENKITEYGESLEKENKWEIETALDGEGRVIERKGKVTAGAEVGRQWHDQLSYVDRRAEFKGKEYDVVVTLAHNRVTEQGADTTKKPAGSEIKKWIVHDKASGDYLTHWDENKAEGEREALRFID
ncbi:hypothetical protein ACFL04_04865 [Patescibacteria group bacterium]